mgnify:CR=1 FL=1
MTRYEYKAIPAPRKGEKSKDARTTPDRFANTLTQLMNRLGAEGWEYLRADTLPCEERVGFTGKQTTFQHMLIFRRPLAQPAAAPAPQAAPAPESAPIGWPLHDALAARAPAADRPTRPAPGPAPAAAPLPQADPMDDAARRAGVIPTIARPVFGTTPRLVATPVLSRRAAPPAAASPAHQDDPGA